ncbi:MAG: transposase [Terriglobales bacterium]
MPTRLRRSYGLRDLHFITCSCYRRQSLLATRHARDVRIFEQVRRKYKCEVVGYVVMPEHFHVLIGEPETGTTFDRFTSSEAERFPSPSEPDGKAIQQPTPALDRRRIRNPEPPFLAGSHLRFQCLLR